MVRETISKLGEENISDEMEDSNVESAGEAIRFKSLRGDNEWLAIREDNATQNPNHQPLTNYHEVTSGDFVCKVPLSLVKDKLYRAAFIVLRRSVKNFSCNDWNADFFKNVGSTFSVYRRLDDDSAITFYRRCSRS